MKQKQKSNMVDESIDSQISIQFFSLSGRSGILTGIYALLAAFAIAFLLRNHQNGASWVSLLPISYLEYVLCLIAFLVCFFSLIASYRPAARRARQLGLKFRQKVSRKLLFRFFTPMLLGLIISIFFYRIGMINIILPTTLAGFGVACALVGITMSKNVLYFGFMEVLLGICGFFFPSYGLYFWAIGFGVLPIVYGLFTFKKYNHLK